MPYDAEELAAGDYQEKHDADGEVEVLGAHLEAQGQAEAQHADHERGKGSPDDGPLSAGGERPAQHDRRDDGKRVGGPQIGFRGVQL